MKKLVLLVCFIGSIHGHLTCQLNIEWFKEFNGPADSAVTGITLQQNFLLVSLKDKLYRVSYSGSVQATFTASSEVVNLQKTNNKVYTICSTNLEQRAGNGIEENNHFLYFEPNIPAFVRKGHIYKSRLYAINHKSWLLKFDLTGNQVLRADIGYYNNNESIHAGGNFIYIQSFDGHHHWLMQYDTLLKKKWSVETTYEGRGLLADDNGNCYALTADGGYSTLKKYDKTGKVVWTRLALVQFIRNIAIRGDSIYTCGSNKFDNPQHTCAYMILSATDGHIIDSQEISIANEDQKQQFTQIVPEGENIFLAGTYGSENIKSFVVKLGKMSTGITAAESDNKVFDIFPNPASKHK
jgi:hypothetical protein